MKFLFSTLLLVLAISTNASFVLKERIESPPLGWIQQHRASSTAQIQLHIFVKQTNLNTLESLFWQLSNPKSTNYGQWLTNEEVHSLIAPSSESVNAIKQWLREHNIDMNSLRTSPNSDIISVIVSVKQAETLLNTHFYQFKHSNGQSVVRSLHYSIPSSIESHIDFIGPFRFPDVRIKNMIAESLKELEKAHENPSNGPCDLGVSPTCLRTIYNVNDYAASNNTKASVLATGYLEQYISLKDLESFFTNLDPKQSGRVPTIVGPNVETNPGVEASLDIQYMMAMAVNVPATFWYTAGRQGPSGPAAENEPFLEFLQTLSSTSNAPTVVSTSYGDNENTVDIIYSQRVDIEFQKAGVRGISMLFSSGDGGVGGGQPTQCTTFIPTYPAGSPYITAVGATQSVPEVAAALSSGGFANYNTQPSYQKEAVQHYLTTAPNLPSSNLYNATGRGFPDVSAQGMNYWVYSGGFPQPVSGTSCSSPAFAGLVGLLNDVRAQAGKPSLGFLNPLFYQNPQVFNDITSGNNPGCGTNGFTASAGWDPVTGLGTPDFKKMAALVVSV